MRKYSIFCALAIVLFACTPVVNPESEDSPTLSSLVDASIKQNGEIIEVLAPGSNNFEIDKPIVLMIRNVSDYDLIFRKDFNARIFISDNNQWIEVKDKVAYSDLEDIVLKPDKNFDPFKVGSLILLPDLIGYTDKIVLRIFVIGNMIQDGQKSSEVIATYIDVTLYP